MKKNTLHRCLLFLIVASTPVLAPAHETPGTLVVDATAVTLLRSLVAANNPASNTDATELKFSDLYRLPIGREGLEPSPKLRALNGKRTRMSGYMVHQELASPGVFILTPVPVATEEISDGMADDMPAAQVFVHLPDSCKDIALPHTRALLRVEGVLDVGARNESDGRVSSVRLQLDAVPLAAQSVASVQVPKDSAVQSFP